MNEKKGFLLLMLGFFAFVISVMLRPFFGYIIGAMILAFLLRKPHNRLKNKIGERPSALVVTGSSILLAVLPVIIGGAAAADDARDVISDLSNGTELDFSQVEQTFQSLTGQRLDLEKGAADAINALSSATLGNFTGIVSALAGAALGISLMIFLEYYFIKDGRRLIEWLIDFSPLPEDIERHLLKEVSQTTSAVLKGHILVAIAQGLIAGVGLAVFGVPNYIFWTFIMIIAGVIPILGSMIVWLPASAYLVVTGEPLYGLILALYGFIVVGLSDNILRPLFVDRSAELNPALIILGVLGGVTVLGPIGLFIGPIIFGIFRSISNVFIKNYDELG